MTRAPLRLALGAALLATPLGGQEQTPSFPAGTEIVTVDAVVVDRKGEPLEGLAAGDFKVEEDGVAQQVLAFEAVARVSEALPPAPAVPGLASRSASNTSQPAGRGFVIVFDELHLDTAEAERSRRALASFLQGSVSRGDLVSVVGTHAGMRWTARMPDGREALLAVLSRLQGRRVSDHLSDAISDWEAMRIDRDSDPIVTDQVVRRFVATGAIHRDTRLRGDAPDRGEDLDSERSFVRGRAAQAYQRAANLNETTLGLIERSLESLAPVRGRKALVLASEGLINDTHLPAYRRTVDAARRANVVVYFVDGRGLVGAPAALQAQAGAPLDFNDIGSSLQAEREQSEGSEGLAADTGGFSIRGSNDLEGGLQRIGREAAAYYLIGYRPSNTRADGRFRTIRVSVARESVTVRARRGYYAPGGKVAPSPGRDAALQRALDSPFDLAEVPLRATAHVFGEKEAGTSRVLLTTEVDTRALAFGQQGGAAKDAIEYLLVVADRQTGEFHRIDQQFELSLGEETRAQYARSGFPISRELALAPGEYQARIVARDRNSGRLGSLTYDFPVGPAAGLRISTPVLNDRLPGEGRPPEAIARRVFTPEGVLHGHFEVYGAEPDAATGLPNVVAGFGIRRSDGRFLAAAPATALKVAPDGALTRTLGVPLAEAPPGSYELVVVVKDNVTGRTAEAREPFAIEATAR